MNCRYVKRHLQPFLEQLIEQDQYGAIEKHLENCAICAHELESLKEILSDLKESGYPKLTESQWNSMHDSILAALPGHQSKKFKVLVSSSQSSFFFSPPLRAIAALFIISLVTAAAFNIPRISGLAFFNHFKTDAYPKVVAINGNAISFTTATSTIPVTADFAMAPGHTIQTDNSSSLQIKVDEKSAINLGKSTQCSVKDFASNKAIFTLQQGDLHAQVSKRKPNQLFRIETPNAFCEVIGTRFDVTTQHDSFHNRFITTLLVHEGTVKFGSSEKTTLVTAGNAVALFGDSLGTTLACDIQQLRNNPDKGHFSITSVPSGAAVSINGVPFGTTPLDNGISYGVHSIRLSQNGFKEWVGTIEINAFATTDTLIALRQITGKHKLTNTIGSVKTTGELLENAILQNAFRLINNGYYFEAIVELNRLIDEPATSSALKAVALHKLSICYKNIGDTENALKMLNMILSGNYGPEQKGLAIFERATIYKTSLHEPVKAAADYEQYLSSYKKGIWAEEAALSLAEIFHHSQSYKRAAEVYQLFCNTYKDNSQYEKALYTLGSIYYNNLSDYNRAMSTYSRLLQDFPQSQYSDDATFWGADCLLRLGHASRALAEFNNYLNRYPQGKWSTEATTRLHRIETSEAR